MNIIVELTSGEMYSGVTDFNTINEVFEYMESHTWIDISGMKIRCKHISAIEENVSGCRWCIDFSRFKSMENVMMTLDDGSETIYANPPIRHCPNCGRKLW